jgi:hypothetical protein
MDGDVIAALQAQLAGAFEATSTTRLSERNVVELVRLRGGDAAAAARR